MLTGYICEYMYFIMFDIKVYDTCSTNHAFQ